jgi:hypothetical protein
VLANADPTDSLAKHNFDTVKGGDFLGDQTQSRFSGLALGITGEELGLGRHVTEAGRLTARLGR